MIESKKGYTFFPCQLFPPISFQLDLRLSLLLLLLLFLYLHSLPSHRAQQGDAKMWIEEAEEEVDEHRRTILIQDRNSTPSSSRRPSASSSLSGSFALRVPRSRDPSRVPSSSSIVAARVSTEKV